jgi:hypothetical protein
MTKGKKGANDRRKKGANDKIKKMQTKQETGADTETDPY